MPAFAIDRHISVLRAIAHDATTMDQLRSVLPALTTKELDSSIRALSVRGIIQRVNRAGVGKPATYALIMPLTQAERLLTPSARPASSLALADAWPMPISVRS